MLVYSETVLQGTTWNGLIIKVKEDGEPKDLTGAEVKVFFRQGSTQGDIMYVTQDSDIEIFDEYKIRIKPLLISFEDGLYYGDVRLELNGIVKTYLRIAMTVERTTHG